ncbi:hypothetical protein N7472_003377 [Penicillium cf. griseofulvum]|uniref:Uncharacterized protein n=1 Tax=Penicillium cf. griseofulvum TaxID=2972120 RepID=A0A9W9T2E4_9EURO|nr:hypothetical protein N7472_003377 [Penicillium cf. griseofulvum]KAJ5448101.1 hypothetical protein N7445_002922 [Penicillium cf. griseofulvum]
MKTRGTRARKATDEEVFFYRAIKYMSQILKQIGESLAGNEKVSGNGKAENKIPATQEADETLAESSNEEES